MDIQPVVLYHITDPSDISPLEEIIRQDDEEAFAQHGPYFKEHRGNAHLLNVMDIGIGSDVWNYLQERYDMQGGFEVAVEESEREVLVCLLDSPDCFACYLEGRFLILPNEEMSSVLVSCLVQRARKRGLGQNWDGLADALRTSRQIACWPYAYVKHLYRQEKRIRFLTWPTIAFMFAMQCIPLFTGFLGGMVVYSISSSVPRHLTALGLAYAIGGLGMYLSGTLAHTGEETRDKASGTADDVEYEAIPFTDFAVGFLLACAMCILNGHF